jgi:hypothetical protein
VQVEQLHQVLLILEVEGCASKDQMVQFGGAGGKGVVILSMPDADYSGTTTGSPTVATGVSVEKQF